MLACLDDVSLNEQVEGVGEVTWRFDERGS